MGVYWGLWRPGDKMSEGGKDAVHAKSAKNHEERARTSPARVQSDVLVAHNYSTHSLNSTQLAKEKLRNILASEPDYRFTYCPDYQQSMTVVPVDVEAIAKAKRENSIHQWKTPGGFVFPGKKTSQDCNVHPQKPHPARIQEVQEEWVENILHANVLEPTLERDRLQWEERNEDFNIWTKPASVFGVTEPATIHLAGEKLKEEKTAMQQSDREKWKSKVVVSDVQMHFHRHASETEATLQGFKSSNQMDRLCGLLKDAPQKLSLSSEPNTFSDIPSLNVVLNPRVDYARRAAGLPLLPAVDNDSGKGPGFAPGPYRENSWVMAHNIIPIRDYEHTKFHQLKGQDFNVYHKPRSCIHRRTIRPLTDEECASQVFNWPVSIPRKSFIIPSISDIKAEQYSEVKVQKTMETC